MSENTPFASAWREDTIRSIVDPSRPITYGVVQPGTRLDQGVPIIRGQDYSGGLVDDSDLYLIHPTIAASYKRSAVKGGDIIFSIVGYLGQTAIVPEHLSGANITQTTARIAVKHPYLSRFFLQQFRSENFAAEVRRCKKGSAQPGLNLADVEKMKVVIPLPEDQSRIAAVLDTVDEAIAKTEAVIAKLRQVRAGLLQDLLTRGLDNHGQLRDPIAHPEQFQDSPLGQIPNDWAVKAVSKLITGFESGVSVDSFDVPVAEGEIGVLKTGCVTGGIFNLQENKRVKKEDLSRVCCNPKADSLLISRMNTPQLVGESAYVPTSYSHVFLPDRLWQTLKLPGDPTCIQWLGYVIQSKEFREAITGGATGTSGSMKNISQNFFLGLPVRVPPRAEQEKIVAIAIKQDAALAAEQKAHDKMVQLKSGLMTDLLTGRVRVPEPIGAKS